MFIDENQELFSSTMFSTTYTDKIIEEYQLKNQNSLLSLLNSVVLTMTFFCRMSYCYIMKYYNNDQLFLDSYIKRVI